MRWLETDGTWADTYSITGELFINSAENSHDDVDKGVKLVSKVRIYSMTSFY